MSQSKVITTDKDNREYFKNKLLDKIELALAAPPIETDDLEEVAQVEIVDKYSTWVPARLAFEPEELLPDFKKDESFIPQGELERRGSTKNSILNKVEKALITPVELNDDPAPIEIIEKYSTWIPARVDFAPENKLEPEFSIGNPEISPYEIEKRTFIKRDMLDKVNSSLTPRPIILEPEVPQVEIIEKYSKGIPQRSVEQVEGFYSDSRKDVTPVVHESDRPKRISFKDALSNKIEGALTPSIEESVQPVEIIDRYATWTPARFKLETIDGLLPEPKKEEFTVPFKESEKRAWIKDHLLNKVEVALTPVQEETVEPIEIIEKYSNWAPAKLEIEPKDDLLPEPRKEDFVIPPREILKRAEIKHNLLNKIEEAVNPVVIEELEPEPVEIVEKFSSGIPQRVLEPMEPFFQENNKVLNPDLIGTDNPKRAAFKESLLKKVNSTFVTEKIETPIEIVGYEPRTIVPFGLDFERAPIEPLIIGEFKEETITADSKEVFEPVITTLLLPENYQSLDERALYGVLIRNTELKHTSETANLTLDVLARRSSQQVEFVVIESPKPIEAKPIETKVIEPSSLVAEVIEPELIISKPTIKSEPIIQVPIEPFDFVLPADWHNIPLSTLRTDLLATGATPEQVDAKLASLVQTDSSVVQDSVESLDIENQDPVVNLPEEFSTWKAYSQYIYLTKERNLTPDQANSIVWEYKTS